MVGVGILVEQNWNRVPGGTARATNRLIEALHGHTEVVVTGIHGRHRHSPQLELPHDMAEAIVPIPGRLLAETWSRTRFPSIDRWVDTDVIHAPAYVLPPTSRPLVVTVHDLAFVRHPEWFTPNGVAYFTRFLERLQGNDAQVIVPSNATAEDCIERGIAEDRLHVIPWGVDLRQASNESINEVRRQYSLPENFVLFVGTVEPRKNLHTLIDAMARLPDAPLVVVGPAGWGDVDVPEALLLGEVPAAHIEALMAAATVLAYPSHLEGFGLPVLEAMAQATPVITTSNTAPAEIAADGGLAVNTHSVDELAGALDAVLHSTELQRSLGVAGRARAETYTWQATAHATHSVYKLIT